MMDDAVMASAGQPVGAMSELGYTLDDLARMLGRAKRTLENAKRGNELRLSGESRPIRLVRIAGRWLCPHNEWRAWVGHKFEAGGFASPFGETGLLVPQEQAPIAAHEQARHEREPARRGRPRGSTADARHFPR
jgi:hypothetical protein